jgi:uncharacterized protein YegL
MGFASFDEDIQSRLIHDLRSGTVAPSASTTPPLAPHNSAPTKGAAQATTKEKTMATIEIQVAQPRPLPVFVLADVSGSMAEAGKIGSLNQGVRELVAALASAGELFAQPQVSVITFGGTGAQVHLPLTPAANLQWRDMAASGMTPMGAAFTLAQQQIEDRNVVSSRAYRPVLVLVSDGQPNDAWESALDDLLTSDRSARADRFALAIGPDADRNMLVRFTGDHEKVLGAQDAKGILHFFRFVTMSVLSRSRAVQPNNPLPPPPVIDWEP